MTEQSSPRKHELTLSLSDAGMARAAALLERVGHRSLQRLIARGMELVEWVENQQDMGRTVAAVIKSQPDKVYELSEREDLLAPRILAAVDQGQAPKPLLTEAREDGEKSGQPMYGDISAADIKPQAPAPAVPDKPGRSAKKRATAGKAAAAPSARTENRRMAIVNAHRHSDSGPVISLRRARMLSDSSSGVRAQISVPIVYQDKPLPAKLTPAHEPELKAAISTGYTASHFSMSEEDGHVLFYQFIPPKGWHHVEPGTGIRNFDATMNGGLGVLYPVQLALSYLADLEAIGGLKPVELAATA